MDFETFDKHMVLIDGWYCVNTKYLFLKPEIPTQPPKSHRVNKRKMYVADEIQITVNEISQWANEIRNRLKLGGAH